MLEKSNNFNRKTGATAKPDFNKPPVQMVIKAEAECTKCGCKETFYVAEHDDNLINYTCHVCENDKFKIKLRF